MSGLEDAGEGKNVCVVLMFVTGMGVMGEGDGWLFDALHGMSLIFRF